jgi:hypothetical protein
MTNERTEAERARARDARAARRAEQEPTIIAYATGGFRLGGGRRAARRHPAGRHWLLRSETWAPAYAGIGLAIAVVAVALVLVGLLPH